MTVRFRVRGRVQGVGFRWFVVREGRALGLQGEVRNLTDGSVEVTTRGSAAAVGELERQLGIGPPSSLVTSVEREEISDEISPLSGFNIKR